MLVDYYSSLFNLWVPGFYIVNCQLNIHITLSWHKSGVVFCSTNSSDLALNLELLKYHLYNLLFIMFTSLATLIRETSVLN